MTFKTQSGCQFSALPIDPIEIFTSDDLDYVYVGNIVTAENGDRFTVLDAKNVQGRTFRITLLPLDQEAP